MRYIRVVLLAVVVVLMALLSGPLAGAQAASTDSGATLGQADGDLDMSEVIEDLTRKFQAGGLTMWFLLFLSVLSLAFMLERAFRLRKRTVVPGDLAAKADELWKQGDTDALLALCKKRRKSTLAKVLRFAVEHRDSSSADVNEAAGDIASRDIEHHLMLTYPLAAIGALAPLLGLFGTVVGMIDSFEKVAVAGSMGDPTLLAGGISKALVTTAFGLMVAIPTLFFYNVFRFRTNVLGKQLEGEANSLISAWFIKKREDKS